MTGMIIFVLLAAVAVVLLKLSTAQAKATAAGWVEARQICSDNEREFFGRLVRALPEYHVFPQVAANALLRVASGTPKQRRHAARNRFAQKHVDYVVCEKESLKVVAIIELDDRTHSSEKDKARDLMFAQAGYVTHRFESRRKPSEAEIAVLFAPSLPSAEASMEQF